MKNPTQAIYLDIMFDLREKIISGEYGLGQKVQSESSLMDEYKCSRITAKRALDELENEGLIKRRRGSGSYVNDITERTKIGNDKNISMILPPGYLAGNLIVYFYGASSVLAEHGFTLSIASVDPSDSTTDCDLIKRMISNGYSGIIYYPEHDNMNTDYLVVLSMNGFPIVTIDKLIEGAPISSVVADNFYGTHLVTKLLLDKGHKKIAFVSNTDINRTSTSKNRFFGYANALKKRGINLMMENIINGYEQVLQNDHPDVYERVFQLLPLRNGQYDFFVEIIESFRANGITAIVNSSDVVAMYMMKTCEYMGLSLPDDMSLVGFDDHILLRRMGLSITTIRQDLHTMGQKAAELLLECINDKSSKRENLVFPVELIERKSVAEVIE